MARILLVDDEHTALVSAQMLLSSEIENLEVEIAHNAQEAIDRTYVESFSVIIMDICMPGINGLKAIEIIKKRLPQTVFIVLSAYDRFDFAQRAISIGVSRYLLKPVQHDQLVAAVKSALEDANSQRIFEKEMMGERSKFYKLKEIAKRQLIDAVMYRRPYVDDIDQCLDMLGLKEKEFRVIVARIRTENAEDYKQILGKAAGRIEKAVAGLAVYTEDGSVIALFNPMEASEAHEIDRVSKILKLILDNPEFDGCSWQIGIGRRSEKWDDILLSFQEAEQAAQEAPANEVLFYQNTALSVQQRTVSVDEVWNMILEDDRDSLNDCLHALINYWYKSAIAGLGDARINIFEFMIALKQKYNDAYKSNLDTANAMLQERLSEMLTCTHEAAVFEKVYQYALKLCELCHSGISSNTPIITAAIQYISRHYREDITLGQVAEHVGVTQYYLSRQFNTEIGMSFPAYLTDLRMKKAKELLRQNRLSISEICTYIGYPNQAYFSKIFRKAEHMTPSAYRMRQKKR